jgi:Ca2+-binding EF-hand superfamily protein
LDESFIRFISTTGGIIMMSGIGGSSYYASMHPGQQKPAWLKGGPPDGSGPPPGVERPDSGESFKQIDTDGNGGVDKVEFQVLADNISEVSGQKINVEELTNSYDANGDGLLGQDEMQTMMMELQPPQGQGGFFEQQALAAYQVDTNKDLTSTLMDMLGEKDDDNEEESSSINTNA